MFGVTILNKVESKVVPPEGFEYSVTLEDGNVPVNWWINGIHRTVKTDKTESQLLQLHMLKILMELLHAKSEKRELSTLTILAFLLKAFPIMHGITISEAMILLNIQQAFHIHLT